MCAGNFQSKIGELKPTLISIPPPLCVLVVSNLDDQTVIDFTVFGGTFPQNFLQLAELC